MHNCGSILYPSEKLYDHAVFPYFFSRILGQGLIVDILPRPVAILTAITSRHLHTPWNSISARVEVPVLMILALFLAA